MTDIFGEPPEEYVCIVNDETDSEPYTAKRSSHHETMQHAHKLADEQADSDQMVEYFPYGEAVSIVVGDWTADIKPVEGDA